MAPFALAFGLAILPSIAGFVYLRGPTVNVERETDRPDISLPEAAVLRDGALGATRWAFAATLCQLAHDGHCTLARTEKHHWFTIGPAVVIEPHADATELSAVEHTILRQMARHDTLGGFGFAGSTFRRRTLRDVRTNLVERGQLEDRRGRSNTFIALALALFACAIGLSTTALTPLTVSIFSGLGSGSLLLACVRHPLTHRGAHHRAAHRAYAEKTFSTIRKHSTTDPERAATLLLENLPTLILERWATPQRLRTLANRFEAADTHLTGPDWIRTDSDENRSIAQCCRDLAAVLSAMGARTPVHDRLQTCVGMTFSRS